MDSVLIEASTDQINWVNFLSVSTSRTSTNLTSAYPPNVLSSYLTFLFISFTLDNNGTCVYIPYSTVIQCNVFFQVPSGYSYYVRGRAANLFGTSLPGEVSIVVGASMSLKKLLLFLLLSPRNIISSFLLLIIHIVPPAISPSFQFNATAIDLGSFVVGDAIFNWGTVSDDGGNLQITWTVEYHFLFSFLFLFIFLFLFFLLFLT